MEGTTPTIMVPIPSQDQSQLGSDDLALETAPGAEDESAQDRADGKRGCHQPSCCAPPWKCFVISSGVKGSAALKKKLITITIPSKMSEAAPGNDITETRRKVLPECPLVRRDPFGLRNAVKNTIVTASMAVQYRWKGCPAWAHSKQKRTQRGGDNIQPAI